MIVILPPGSQQQEGVGRNGDCATQTTAIPTNPSSFTTTVKVEKCFQWTPRLLPYSLNCNMVVKRLSGYLGTERTSL